ncbi:MAG: CDP-diacylglycerol--glycerol-3-phosphate 3-phosphatidyltransferase [Rickettsiales bacterium]|nr:CDP-diacylglycerol--glycerol-3-phosphate 3-phosphatidyltransferase [Rickettsiales bacterium]|tara:strand:+ start:779 stop:1357 length:579 start_codon:yes stop_codon:yes gene_type:complete
MRNLPNILTWSRIVIIPILIFLMMQVPAWCSWAALGLYTYACITDFFDGYLARKWNVVSPIGKFLDPIADKLLIAAILMTLAALDRLYDYWIIPAMVILIREIFIAGLREYLGPLNIKLPVSLLAKWKTTSQMFCLGFLIVGPHAQDVLPFGLTSLEVGHWLLALAAILAVITGWNYTVIGFQHILNNAEKK